MTTTPIARPATTRPAATPYLSRVPVWLVAAGAVIAGAVVTEAYAWVARAAGVEFLIGDGSSPREDIPGGGFVGAVAMLGAVAVVLAPAFARWAKSPRRTWQRTTWTLVAVSLVPVAPVADAAVSTELALGVGHLVAAAVIIPVVAARLAVTNPRRA
ncbi:hypothetical protein D0Z08_02645 [Nocardioides immobilis]|uniref:Uncharacterized protein n=1 Tax=Nocardioides immobilis TaxID=2049295 RepID=A0A417Y7N9_9ACTN|nr:DUF6069 family protein [Nocardioides immobilis]RHW28768.1 hypothetical protein D0Z08_02645 [Nocardioides immobilis]